MVAFRKLAFALIASLTLMALAAAPSFASQDAVLRNGFSIRHERRAIIGAVTRLYVNADGSSYVDIPTDEIEHFEDAPTEIKTITASAENRTISRPNSIPVDLNQVVSAASGRYRLDPDLVNSVIRAESGFNVRAVSRKGAQGLMQLMPGTASKLGVPNAFDPEANVEGGTKYLRELLERYNFDLVKALAAYNAGPLRVEQYGGVPPYYETRAYVARIVRDFNRKKLAAKNAAAPPVALPKHPKKKLGAGTAQQSPVSGVRAKAGTASE
jgi:soluble lytic murein transglycosylase-like protein